MKSRPRHLCRLTPEQFERLKMERRVAYRRAEFGLKDLAVVMSQPGLLVAEEIDGTRTETVMWDGRICAEREAAGEEYLLRMKLEFSARIAAMKGRLRSLRRRHDSGRDGSGGNSMNPSPNPAENEPTSAHERMG